VLLHVSRRTGREDWFQIARELLDHCLAWPENASGVRDAPLCHGATGVAHIFNRVYQAEGDAECREAAVRWFDRALAMRQPDAWIGGFFAMTWRDPTGPFVPEATPAFLDGAIGVALSLLAALTDVEPAWDRLLLLSGRS
jgi:lantibiotic biosynthesis protein